MLVRNLDNTIYNTYLWARNYFSKKNNSDAADVGGGRFHTPVVRNNKNSSTTRRAYARRGVELFLLFLTTGVWNLTTTYFQQGWRPQVRITISKFGSRYYLITLVNTTCYKSIFLSVV